VGAETPRGQYGPATQAYGPNTVSNGRAEPCVSSISRMRRAAARAASRWPALARMVARAYGIRASHGFAWSARSSQANACSVSLACRYARPKLYAARSWRGASHTASASAAGRRPGITCEDRLLFLHHSAGRAVLPRRPPAATVGIRHSPHSPAAAVVTSTTTATPTHQGILRGRRRSGRASRQNRRTALLRHATFDLFSCVNDVREVNPVRAGDEATRA